MYSITITLKVIKIAIEITFVLKHSQKENKTNLRGFRNDFIISDNIRYE